MRKIILIILTLQVILCFGQNQISTQKKSIISVIVSPESYVDMKINVKGFLSFEKDEMAIYNSKDDYINFNTKNAMYLILSRDDISKFKVGKMSCKYVSITGTFYLSPNKDRQMGDNYIGALKNIDHIELIEQRGLN